MKKLSGDSRFLAAGLAALVIGLLLRLFVPTQGATLHFIEGLCLGLSLALLLGGMIKVRRDSHRGPGRA